MAQPLTRPTIVVHVGMQKAGSTAIQHWLRENGDLLGRHGYVLVVGRPGDGPQLLDVGPYSRGPASSGSVASLLRAPETKAPAVHELAEALGRLANEYGGVVISGEALSQFLSRWDPSVVARLHDLADVHDVRVAQYVRPQHTALEAGWRQWGFRSGLRPSR